MFRERRTDNDEQTTEAGRDYHEVEVLMGQGMARLDAIRQIGVVEQTYYRWRKPVWRNGRRSIEGTEAASEGE